MTVEWSIWDNERRVHYRGPTLENAMEQALGCDADLAMVEQQITSMEHRADGSIIARGDKVELRSTDHGLTWLVDRAVAQIDEARALLAATEPTP